MNEDNAKYLSIGQESVELQYYDDGWSDIGWEVIPPTAPPITSTTSGSTLTSGDTSSTPNSTTPSSTTPNGGTGRITITLSCKYFTFVFLLVNIVRNY